MTTLSNHPQQPLCQKVSRVHTALAHHRLWCSVGNGGLIWRAGVTHRVGVLVAEAEGVLTLRVVRPERAVRVTYDTFLAWIDLLHRTHASDQGYPSVADAQKAAVRLALPKILEHQDALRVRLEQARARHTPTRRLEVELDTFNRLLSCLLTEAERLGVAL